MADSALVAVQALDDQRLKLVDEFVRRAWNMWRSLTPSDWWNDAVAEGAAAYVAQQHIAFVKAMRQQGISYADTMLRLAGVNGLGEIPQYEVVRANTDPWQVAMRVADEYRTQAVKNPGIRPATWDEILADGREGPIGHERGDRWVCRPESRHPVALPEFRCRTVSACDSSRTVEDGFVRFVCRGCDQHVHEG